MDFDGILGSIFNFDNYGELLFLVQNSIWAGAVLGLLYTAVALGLSLTLGVLGGQGNHELVGVTCDNGPGALGASFVIDLQ